MDGNVASTGSAFILEYCTGRNHHIFMVDQRTGDTLTKQVSIGVQIDAATATSVTGSPNVYAGRNNALPDDNTITNSLWNTGCSGCGNEISIITGL
jgi:hypothetical protein